MPNEAYWQRMLAGQGSISKPKSTIGSIIEDGVRKAIKATGAKDRTATRIARKAVGFLNDATPVGSVTEADNGIRSIIRGATRGDLKQAALGAGATALAVLPMPGKKLAKKGIKDILADESGAIRAWHGSAADFDRFSDDFIGTGEGAQGFGYGHYLTDSRRLANSYRNPKMIPNLPADYGKLYEVDINADPQQFLDLESALASQPEAIQEIARNLDLSHLREGQKKRVLLERFAQGAEQADYRATGNHLHDVYTDFGANVEANKRFSQMASERGFAGLQYGQPENALGGGGRNYVVFDPNLLSILNKY